MNNTLGFPPADALIQQLSKIEYKKHAKEFVLISATIIAIVVAFSQFVYTKVQQWYSEGGKDLLLSYAQRAVLFINNKTGAFDKLYAALIRVYNGIESVAHKLSDVTENKLAQ